MTSEADTRWADSDGLVVWEPEEGGSTAVCVDAQVGSGRGGRRRKAVSHGRGHHTGEVPWD